MTMMISAKLADGTFSYEVHNGWDLIEAGKGYPSQHSAEISARVCYNELNRLNFKWGKPFFQNDYMPLDDILDELDV